MQQGLIRSTLAFLVIVCGLLLPCDDTRIFAADASLSWNPNSEPDLAGYKVHYGTSSRTYGTSINVGKKTTYTVTGLSAGTYYFTVTAFDTAGNESGFSNEVAKIITSSVSTTSVDISVTCALFYSGDKHHQQRSYHHLVDQ